MGPYDVILVGGGLANGLIAHFLSKIRPEISFLLIESESRLGGEHTWSFHGTDVSRENFEILKPLISYSWGNYRVQFPRYQREIDISYHSILSRDFHEKLSAQLGNRVRLSCPIKELNKNYVITSNGERMESTYVVDGRGWLGGADLEMGYQKFLGQAFRLKENHGLTSPLLMDATCEQIDGFRFFYLLPFSEKEILIEDTYYSNSSHIDKQKVRAEIEKYLRKKQWNVDAVLYEEMESLPIPLTPYATSESTLQSGMRWGIFNYTTGYSIPDAVKQAEAWTEIKKEDSAELLTKHHQLRAKEMARRKIYFTLNQLMFLGSESHLRYRILEKFYQLPLSTIERFYRSDLNWLDKIRIFTGKPPISISNAAKTLWSARRRERAA